MAEVDAPKYGNGNVRAGESGDALLVLCRELLVDEEAGGQRVRGGDAGVEAHWYGDAGEGGVCCAELKDVVVDLIAEFGRKVEEEERLAVV